MFCCSALISAFSRMLAQPNINVQKYQLSPGWKVLIESECGASAAIPANPALDVMELAPTPSYHRNWKNMSCLLVLSGHTSCKPVKCINLPISYFSADSQWRAGLWRSSWSWVQCRCRGRRMLRRGPAQLGEFPSGKDFLGLSPREVLDGSGGTQDPEETQQDQGERGWVHSFVSRLVAKTIVSVMMTNDVATVSPLEARARQTGLYTRSMDVSLAKSVLCVCVCVFMSVCVCECECESVFESADNALPLEWRSTDGTRASHYSFPALLSEIHHPFFSLSLSLSLVLINK